MEVIRLTEEHTTTLVPMIGGPRDGAMFELPELVRCLEIALDGVIHAYQLEDDRLVYVGSLREVVLAAYDAIDPHDGSARLREEGWLIRV